MALVVSASTGVLRVVLPKLAKLIGDECKLQSSVKDGIRYLHRELGSMQIALEKVSEVPAEQLDPLVKLWATNLRDLSYDIQDTIDSYMLHVDAADKPGSTMACCVNALPLTCKARRDIGTEIKRIRKEVEEVSGRRERYKVDGMAVSAPSDPRLLALYEDKEKLVGIDRSSEQIIELLSTGSEGTSEQKLRLVSIVGPGGMGKTTLANAVYQKLEGKFDCTAFVSVSLQPNIRNIFSSILRQVTSKIKDDPEDKDKDKGKDKSLHRRDSRKLYANTETWSEKEIIDKIRHVLEKRRYLILIDDIWDEQSWKFIKCALFENKLDSKVITTTRNIDVAKSCCSSENVDGVVHELQPLSGGYSEQLFYYRIFGKEGCPTELKVVSQRILEKCKGWPLAIIAIASLLANKPTQTEDQWCSVCNSISTGLENNQGVKDMRLILSLSYCDMPSRLRACLLYLSIFPEDHIIGRDDLIRRWIAEDLVHGGQDDNLYELGDKYFNELINRSMIQPSDVDALGRAQACTIHDLVLEFVTSLSAEAGFVTILNGQQPFPSQRESIHRLSLRNRYGEQGRPQATKRLPHVRTLVVSSVAIDSVLSLSMFPVLRVLDVEDCTRLNFQSLSNLVHLRYLRLSHDYRAWPIKLPEEIGSLQLLQTLDLKYVRIEELPSTMVQLRQLKVLKISLSGWGGHKHFLQFLCNLKQLEVLYIFAHFSLDFMLQLDWAPSHLQRFTTYPHGQSHHMSVAVCKQWSPFSRLPRWIDSSNCCRLTNLSIMVRTLWQSDVETLADLLILRSLDLEVLEVTRLEINGCLSGTGHATTFRCLGNFKFTSRAVGLVFRPGAMQKLQNFHLCFDLPETKEIPGDFRMGLENLASLKTVNVEIDCRWASISGVEAAEAALCHETNLNPNCPTLDLKRRFEKEMIRREEKEIPVELPAKMKEHARLFKVGPFGGNGGRACDIRALDVSVTPHRLEKVAICGGDCVDCFAFSYTDHNGEQRTIGPWGGRGGLRLSTINLGPSEYLIEISGTMGSYCGIANLITSLTFVTNAASYGPFGKGGGDPFILPVLRNSSIVGFFGRAGSFLDAIGFYIRPL